MKPSDKVAVLRDLLTRVRANARDRGAGVPPSSGRAAATAEAEALASATSMRLAMRPPPEDRWDFAPPPIEDPVELTPIDLPPVPALEPAMPLPPSDPPEDRHDSGGVLLDLDAGELPEVERRPSIPPLSPPPPSRLRAVDSAANADPEAMRFWLSALTTPKSSPPTARDTIPDETIDEASRYVETEPASQPSERSAAIAEAETEQLPRAPRVPRWSEPVRETPAPPTPLPSQPLSHARGDTSSPALVAPASERVGRTTNGPLSRRRSVRVRLRPTPRSPGTEKSSRWLRGALGIAGGAAIGILAYRLVSPHAVVVDEASLAAPTEVVSRNVALAPSSSAIAGARAPAAPTPASSTANAAASGHADVAPSPASSELVAAAAAPIPPPPPLELGVPAPSLAEDRGRLIVHSKARATVYVNGVRSGATNAPFDVPCGMRNVRLAKEGWPPPGKSFPMWSSAGVTVMVPCRAAFEIDLEPETSTAP